MATSEATPAERESPMVRAERELLERARRQRLRLSTADAFEAGWIACLAHLERERADATPAELVALDRVEAAARTPSRIIAAGSGFLPDLAVVLVLARRGVSCHERAQDGRQAALAAVKAFCATVNAHAEAAILAGEPLTGAHHRAIEAELARLRGEVAP